MAEPKRKRRKLSSGRMIMLGFAAVILIGTFLLILPVSSSSGVFTPFCDALFTATSAVCVTGLVVHDTATYWSYFGQFIILVMIQIGGLGIITIVAAFAIITGKKFSLMDLSTMKDAVSALKLNGITRLISFIMRVTLFIELAGALVMAPVFYADYGPRGLWMALFHSVSAFCNAGFDLMGVNAEYSSLTSYAFHPLINAVIILLIIIGGIGFMTWDDVKVNRLKFRRYRLQSKVIICTSAFLIVFPAVYFYIFEFDSLKGAGRLMASLFQSVTTRTAGFNTSDLTALSEAGKTITILLMIIGGSPGSTAGGMKTTTAAVIFAAAVSTFLKRDQTALFGRRINDETVKTAATLLTMYLVLSVGGGIIISIAEDLPMVTALFETASAAGTVGLSLGVTPALGTISRIVLIILMFCGRVGGLTIIFATLPGIRQSMSRYPQEKIIVG